MRLQDWFGARTFCPLLPGMYKSAVTVLGPYAAQQAGSCICALTAAAPHAGVHWVMLGWTKTRDFDLDWLRKDLAAVDRAHTPWLVAVIHPPWCAPGARSASAQDLQVLGFRV